MAIILNNFLGIFQKSGILVTYLNHLTNLLMIKFIPRFYNFLPPAKYPNT